MRLMLICGAGALLTAGPAMAENWHSVAHSANTARMIDVDAIATDGDVKSAPVAAVPRQGDAGDYSHTVETYQFRCAARQWRTAGMVEHNPDGGVGEAYPEEDAAWEPVQANTLPAYLKQMVCDGARSPTTTWPSIKAFVDSGRVLADR